MKTQQDINTVVRKHNHSLNQKTCRWCYYNNVCDSWRLNLEQNKYGKLICSHFSNQCDFKVFGRIYRNSEGASQCLSQHIE